MEVEVGGMEVEESGAEVKVGGNKGAASHRRSEYETTSEECRVKARYGKRFVRADGEIRAKQSRV
jgi:hypothetical protein